MANQFASGETYADGQTVNAARLNNTVNLATAQPGLITEQGLVTPVPADQILLQQASSGLLKRTTLSSLTGTHATFSGTPSNPTGTTNSTYPGVMMGIPGTITPQLSGSFFVGVTGSAANNAANAGGQIMLRYGIGSKPNNGDSPTGTNFSTIQTVTSALADDLVAVGLFTIVVGLIVGTAYWLDVSINANPAAIPSGTFYLKDIAISAFEF